MIRTKHRPLAVTSTRMKITKEILKIDPDVEGSFIVEFIWQDSKIDLRLDPDDVPIEETLTLANKIIGAFGIYLKKAEDIIVNDFLDNY